MLGRLTGSQEGQFGLGYLTVTVADWLADWLAACEFTTITLASNLSRWADKITASTRIANRKNIHTVRKLRYGRHTASNRETCVHSRMPT